jgi:hypothetical protein
VHQSGIRSHIIDFYRETRQISRLISSSGIRYINTMLPRRRAKPLVANRAMEREMREIRSRLDAMETTQRRAPDGRDVSDAENEEVEVEEVVAKDVVKEGLLKAAIKLGARAKINIPMYEGNLDVEELLDWIRAMDKYFDYEYVDEEENVKHTVTRLKDLQHCGGMNCRLTEEARENKRLRVGIEW